METVEHTTNIDPGGCTDNIPSITVYAHSMQTDEKEENREELNRRSIEIQTQRRGRGRDGVSVHDEQHHGGNITILETLIVWYDIEISIYVDISVEYIHVHSNDIE